MRALRQLVVLGLVEDQMRVGMGRRYPPQAVVIDMPVPVGDVFGEVAAAVVADRQQASFGQRLVSEHEQRPPLAFGHRERQPVLQPERLVVGHVPKVSAGLDGQVDPVALVVQAADRHQPRRTEEVLDLPHVVLEASGGQHDTVQRTDIAQHMVTLDLGACDGPAVGRLDQMAGRRAVPDVDLVVAVHHLLMQNLPQRAVEESLVDEQHIDGLAAGKFRVFRPHFQLAVRHQFPE
ncbi:hypothetical protein SDC9_114494 [bioreactor metagenome]|uniref:Uncharacterized protein n=1 Tax=bioreactor metagenome TaxID=1076179 RepID=A0A645BSI9_9ZZZZ